MVIKRLVVLLGSVVLLGIELNTGQAVAGIYSWIGGDGHFNNAYQWSPNGPPGSADIAYFGSGGSYAVLWDDSTGNRTNASWQVQNGHVTMRKLSGSTYSYTTTDNAYIDTYGWLTLGAPGLPLNLAIGGTLSIDTGTFEIIEGAAVINTANIGYNGGANATVILAGGALWVSNECIGCYGRGEFFQSGGAHQVNNSLIIANDFDYSSGTYTLSGGTLTASDEYIGYERTGDFIQSGGTNTTGSLTLGFTYTGTGADFGSYNLSGGDLLAGDEFIGVHSDGTFTQTGGTNTANNLYLGVESTSNGTYNLNGGTLNVAGIAYGAGTGAFNFNAGTLHFSDDLTVPSTGLLANPVLTGIRTLAVDGTTTLSDMATLTLAGGTFSTGSLVNNGGFAFNSGTFNLTGDNLVVGSGGLFGDTLSLGSAKTVNVTNTTTVDGDGLLYLNGGKFSTGNLVNNGQVALDGVTSNLGGAVSNNGLLNGNGRVSAVLNNNAGGEVLVGSGDTLRFTAAGNSNSGEITLSGGTARFDQDLTNTSTGTISGRGTLYAGGGLTNQGNMAFSSGTTDIFGDVNNTGGGRIVVSGNGTLTFYDDVVHNGTEIRTSAGSNTVFFGEVSGSGPYTGTGSLFFEGDLAPGNSPGLVTVGGNMNLGISSHTVMEIAGLKRGTEYDAFEVGGDLWLGGELEVSLLDLDEDLFAPQLGDSFDLFTAETITGDFDLLTLAILGGGLDWQLDFLADEIGTIDVARLSVVASAVPVPPAVWLFGSGLLGLMAIARKRQAA